MDVLRMNNLILKGLSLHCKDTTMCLIAAKNTDTAYAQNEKLYDRLNE